MKWLAMAVGVAMLGIACGNSKKTTDNESGWTVLFDGSNTNAWHVYGGGAVGPAWKIIDKALVLDTSQKKDGSIVGGGNLVSNESYENFDLKYEWKISKGGNSGVMFYVQDDKSKYQEPYLTGPEMQVIDNDGHADGKIARHRAGDLYDLIACKTETVKPVGEWNQAEIISLNGKLELWLNGTMVVSTTMWNDSWKNLVANSKFKNWKDFAVFKTGHICLQDHGDMVSYRNIIIKKL